MSSWTTFSSSSPSARRRRSSDTPTTSLPPDRLRPGTKSHVDAKQELLALGAANLGSGLLHGFPVSSSGSRTAIGDAIGGRTQLAGLVTVRVLLSLLSSSRPLLASFPSRPSERSSSTPPCAWSTLPSSGGFAAFRRSEFLLAAGTTAPCLVVGVLVRSVGRDRSLRPRLAPSRRPASRRDPGIVPGLAGMHDVDDYPPAEPVPGLLVYRYDSPLFFANAEDFRRRALAAVDHTGGPVAGSSSTPRQSSRSTSLPWTRSRPCAGN